MPRYQPHRICPICHQPVEKTRKGNIAGHFDKATKPRPCPMSYQPYDTAYQPERIRP